MPRTPRRYVRRLSGTGAGWPLGEIILIAITLAAIMAACGIIVYEMEVKLPERQGIVPAEYGMVDFARARRHGEFLGRANRIVGSIIGSEANARG